MQQTILISGGAGYIGSHTAFLLAQKGHKIIIIDNFLHNQKVNIPTAIIIKSNFANKKILHQIFSKYKVDAVMHFAACIEVGESMKNPQKFYVNNVQNTLILLDCMLQHNVKKLIFSSSCAVYGKPQYIPIDEKHPCVPISPYGKNKLAIEFALQDYAHAYDFQYVSLRYFNAAGAMPKIGLGEQHKPETHIIPLMLQAAQKQKPFKIFGNDYDTPDGTCIRDYIHVRDIARAHILALDYLQKTNTSDAFNLGSGNGFSVKEMVAAIETMTGKKLQISYEPRRTGDPAILLANATKIQKALGWKPQYSNLTTILKSAWQFTSDETFSQSQAFRPSTLSDAHAHK